jgi:type II secretory pathway pseudopilin PulG
MKHCTQTGRSMIEMLGVLAIIGVLSVGGIAGFYKAMQKYKINSTVSQITHLVTRIRVAFVGQKNYKGLGETPEEVNAVLYNTNCLPKNSLLRNEDGEIIFPYQYRNAFKGDISVRYADRYVANDYASFIIRYDFIPKHACVAIATSNWGGPNGSGYIASSINVPLPKETNMGNCTPTNITQERYAIHCANTGVMPNEAAARACRSERNNFIEVMFY